MKPIIKRVTIMLITINLLMVSFSFNFASSPASAAAAEPAAPRVSKAAEGEPAPGLANRTLSSVLNPDGTVKAGIETDGSYDASGYRMETTAHGAPRLVQASCGPPNTGSWATEFDLLAGVNGAINVMLASGNDLYVGGSFTRAGNVAANGVARFNTLTRSWSVLGADGNGVNGAAYALTLVGSDLYIGGEFTQANVGGAVVAANNLAQFNTLTNAWSAVGSDGNGVSGYVAAFVAVGSDLYIGGNFRKANVGGTPVDAYNVVKFDLLSNTWSKVGSGPGNGVGGEVYALAVISNDLYIGGNFIQTDIGGSLFGASYIVRFSPQTNTWSRLGTDMFNGLNGSVRKLLVSGSDIYIGGDFTNGIVRFSTQTNTFSALGNAPNLRNGVNGTVYELAIISNEVYVGGLFTLASSGLTTIEANHVAKFNPATGAWSALANGGNGVGNGAGVYALAAFGNNLYAGGSFGQANAGSSGLAVSNLAIYDTWSNAWDAVGTAVGNGLSGNVSTMLINGSDLYVGGLFTSINAGGTITLAHNVARFDTKTNTWSKLGSDGGGVDGLVYALAVIGDDIYVGGVFQQANVGGATVPVNRVARFNLVTNTWSKLGSDGNGVNGGVTALAARGSDLYVGGSFGQVNAGGSVVQANNVARFDTKTNTWGILGFGSGNGVNGGVATIAVSGNYLYVGGRFTEAKYNVVTVPANNIARYDTLDRSWSVLGFLGNGVNSQVLALAMIGNDLYVGGFFTQANLGNAPVDVNYIARYNTQNNIWIKLGNGTGNGLDNLAFALAVSGNDLYVGGQLKKANVGGTTVDANNLVKFDTLTETWSKLGTGSGNGLDNSAFALAASHSDLYAGGQFRKANVGGADGGTPSKFIGKFSSAPPTTTQVGSSLNPSADTQNVTLTATVTAKGGPVDDGCVTFKEGSITLAANLPVDSNGQAVFTIAAPFTAGNHTITAFYSGAAEFNSSVGSIVQTVVRNQPPVARCKNVTIAAGPDCTASASVDNGSSDPEGDTLTLTQTPAGPYPKGATPVTLTVTDSRGGMSQCIATVTVVDTTPPQMTCPANRIIAAPPACPLVTSTVVNYPAPLATDNCPGVTVACNPPSGSSFPVGITNVTCTATDAAGNAASCSFAVTVYDLRLQDDINPATVLLFNSLTGQYRLCAYGNTYTGTGGVSKRGCTITLTHNAVDRRLQATVDTSMARGNASLQTPAGAVLCSITDRDIRNDSAICP
jgi:hypothetical protein